MKSCPCCGSKNFWQLAANQKRTQVWGNIYYEGFADMNNLFESGEVIDRKML
jgi:hypothetical protein